MFKHKCGYIFIGIALLAISCKREYKGDLLPPEMKSATSNFVIVEPLSANYFNGVNKTTSQLGKVDSISFQRDSVIFKNLVTKEIDTTYYFPFTTYFKASFNEEVRWTIKIRQFSKQSSKLTGAEKTLSGLSTYSTLDNLYHIDSLNSSWNGNSDGQIFFNSGDSVMAELSVLGSTETKSILLVIAKSTYYSLNDAILLNDFEGGFSQISYNDKADPFPSPLPSATARIVPPQGKFSFLIKGTDNNGDYFIGGVQHKLPTGAFANKKASDIYLNFYIYGFGPEEALTPNATKLNIGISEDDAVTNGTFEPLIEDSFEQQVNVDWRGWKLISVRYSNLKKSGSLTNGGNGNNIIEPEKAFSVNVNLISSPNGSTVGTAIDYVIVTYGKPFEK